MRKLLAVIPLVLVACGGPTILTNPNTKFPLALSETEPMFLFPINMSHLGAEGDPLAMGISVSAGIIGKFGKTVISGQQLFDLVGNLSFELAEQIQSQVGANTWDMTGGAEPIASNLANLMTNILQKLVELGLLPQGYKFKYIIALHSHGTAGVGGKFLNVETWGGLYEVESKTILSYIKSEDSYANEEAAILGQLPLKYNAIIENLVNGGVVEEKKEEEKPAEEKPAEQPAQ